jgi:phosphoserine phosphatase
VARVIRAALVIGLLAGCAGPEPDPLPSWNPGPAREAVTAFVAAVTDPGNPAYVAPADRVAVLDNDGTLLVERPTPLQFEFMFARVRALAADNPEWETTEPFRSVLENDREALRRINYENRRLIGNVTLTGMMQDDFDAVAGEFIATARHPRYEWRFVDLVYQPMLELIVYLQANAFEVFIVTGGGIEFTRLYADDAYGIPRENVIGSSRQLDLREQDGRLALFRKPVVSSINAGRYKPVNIRLHTGRRPILAVGNSDGDLEMLRFVGDNPMPSLVLLIDHDDADREYAYGDGAERVRNAAAERGWPVVSMREDFRTVFPANRSP